MPGLHFDITADNSNFVRKLRETERGVEDATRQIERSGMGIEELFKRMTQAAAGFFTLNAAKDFARQVATVRGEFQQLEVAFKTMLQSKEKADALMSQLVRTAAITPLGLQDVANGAKQLLAYGLASDKVNETLVRLGDIAAGLSIPLGDLVYLYGTTMTQGRLFTLDLRQFMGRGIPLADELAKQFGVTKDKVGELVTAGKVGFPEVQKAIESLTNEGGKFGGLMEEQSKTITGQISNIEDAVSVMFNEIGQKSEGAINTALSGVSYLVENYEKVGRVLLEIVGTYGAYKAALITLNAVEKLRYQMTLAHMAGLTNMQAIMTVLKAKTDALTASMLKNPYVLVAAAVAGLAYGIYKLVTYQTDAQKAQERLNETFSDMEKEVASEKLQIDNLFARLRAATKGTEEYKEAKQAIISQYGNYLSGLSSEIQSLQDVAGAYNAVREAVIGAAKARALEKVQRDAADTYVEKESKQLGIIRKALKDKFGDETDKEGMSLAEKYYEQIKGTLDGKTKVKEDFLNNLNSGLFDFTGSNIYGALRNIKEAKKIYEDTIKEAESDTYFGKAPAKAETAASEAEKPVKSLSETVKEAREKVAGLRKELSDLQSGKLPENAGTDFDWTTAIGEKKKELDEAQKTLDTLTGKGKGGKSVSGTREKEAEKQKAAQEKLNEELLALHRENEEAGIALMAEGTEKRLRQIDNDYEREKALIGKQERELSEMNKKAGVTDVNAGGLTSEQQDEIDKAYKLAEETRQKAIEDTYRSEFESMNDFLKEYGTFQQKKLAIAEEYAEKIRKAQNEGERRSLEKERDSRLAGVEAQELKANIDWSVVFGEFGGMFHDVIAPELEKVKEYMKTDEFKNADHESQEALVNALRQMEQSLGGADKVSFKQLGSEITEYRKKLADLKDAQDKYKDSHKTLSEAQERYIQAVKSGTLEEQVAAENALKIAQTNADAAEENVSSMQSAATAARNTMTSTATTLETSMEGVVEGLQQISSGSLSGAYNGLIKLGDSAKNVGGKLGKAFGKVADTLENVPIIGWILAIIDVLKDGLSQLVEGILDAVFNAVSGIISDVLSGDLAVTLVKSIAGGIGKIFDALTFGAFSSWFSSSNAKEVQEITDRLTKSNDRLRESVDKLKDEMSNSGGWKAISASEQAEKDQAQINRQTMDILRAQMGYHGAHHSNSYYWGLGSNDYASLNKSLKAYAEKNNKSASSVGSLEDMYKLTPEEMDYIRTYNIDMWEKMLSQGKYDKSEYWENYADLAGQLEEITESLNENLTQTSFDSLRDSFIDSLMDMDKSAEDFADDFSEYLMKSILNAKISDLLDDSLQKFYDTWAEYAKSGNVLTGTEREALRQMYEEITRKGLEIREEVASFTGYDGESSSSSSSRSATTRSVESVSQESVDEVSGRLTAMQELHIQILESLSALSGLATCAVSANGILSEIRELSLTSNDYLFDIRKNGNAMLSQFGEKLDKVITLLG